MDIVNHCQDKTAQAYRPLALSRQDLRAYWKAVVRQEYSRGGQDKIHKTRVARAQDKMAVRQEY